MKIQITREQLESIVGNDKGEHNDLCCLKNVSYPMTLEIPVENIAGPSEQVEKEGCPICPKTIKCSFKESHKKRKTPELPPLPELVSYPNEMDERINMIIRYLKHQEK